MIINTYYKGEDIPVKRGSFNSETKVFRRDNVPMIFKTCILHEVDVIEQLEKLGCQAMEFYGLHWVDKHYDITFSVPFDKFKRKSRIQIWGEVNEKRKQYIFNAQPFIYRESYEQRNII